MANLQPNLPFYHHREQSGYVKSLCLFQLSTSPPAFLRCCSSSWERCYVSAEPSPLQQLCRNRFPLPFLFGSSSSFFARNSCSSAPVVQPERLSSGAAQTELRFTGLDRDPLLFFSPYRILLLFYQTNNLLRLLLLLIFCSLDWFHAPFCSQRCLS